MTNENTVNINGNEKNFKASRATKYADAYSFNKYAFVKRLYAKKNTILHIKVVSTAMSSLENFLLFFLLFFIAFYPFKALDF